MKVYTTIPERSILAEAVFVYPTETCYGLGCDALRADLVQRIYIIKNRSSAKSISWIVSDLKMAENFVEFSEKARELALKFWPGRLTLVLRLKKKYARIFGSSPDSSIGIRVSSCSIASDISRILDAPIVATSANVSGSTECYMVKEVATQFAPSLAKPDFAIDQGFLQYALPTTIARVTGDAIEILRQGEIVVS